MITYAESKATKPIRILTVTKGINFETGKQRMVMDFYLELNQPTTGNHHYVYLSHYNLKTVLSLNIKVIHKMHPWQRKK